MFSFERQRLETSAEGACVAQESSGSLLSDANCNSHLRGNGDVSRHE